MSVAAAKSARGKDEPLDAKRALEAAEVYFRALFNSLSVSNLSLEEVQMSPDRKHWLVTLSFEEARPKSADLPSFLRVPRQKFKVFEVECRTGRVIAMKMRDGG